ncbi:MULTISPECIES: AraC family transcriptional regulator [unclassified Janthinobacterium]|uniref:AraC family transcriptional regulator n=1 Tax=unclassified Janthinobacterium TaxID=2610881 RepID=UPI001618671B|nr:MULTISPECIES: AraC family transcriptional regulator [unclassified Janthinobacterium]MBB5371628.1 AraC-like DNA-binding protein [Janthinobacterium sp. K2C7]MBB5384433.1 AraC-like DNA-binding protein [Janthinobacterium sp. K2Li3]MBB5389709.1 AraC-like DNA-binding protein [Janthinobacterium sp. K2E3]
MRDHLNSDPLASIVGLLRPRTVLSKFVSGSGSWAVQYPNYGQPSFCLMLEGSCWMQLDASAPFLMEPGDYILLPATPGFRMGSDLAALEQPVTRIAEASPTGEVHHGNQQDAPAIRMLGGYFLFDPTSAPLLVSLLPSVIHIKAADSGADHLAWIVRAIGTETQSQRPGADAILMRLVEVMLIEALRWQPPAGREAMSGLLAGLSDTRMAVALRLIHADVARRWTVEDLASQAGMSRAAFAARFMQVLGIPPMEYVLRWRMALAKDMLWHDGLSLGEVAHAIGYQSASAFSTAFSRSVGLSPSAFARSSRAATAAQ